MALPGTALVRLRALCNLGQCFYSKSEIGLNVSGRVRWYKTKARTFQDSETPAEATKRGNPNLLKEFPEPKGLLSNAISRSLGVSDISNLIQYHCTENGDVKKATVTVLWPTKIEMEGFASRRLDAERFAAAAACQKLKELGVLGPDNQLPRKGAGRGRGARPSALFDAEEDPVIDHVHTSGGSQSQPPHPQLLTRSSEEDSTLYKALSTFPQPKHLLARVIQVATSSNSFRELVQYKTSGGKVKRCELTLRWPENLTFVASAGRRVEAEKRASALACLKLKELDLLDQDNNPLTHARYHKEQVREAGERDRQPCPLEIPQYLEDRMREYLTQYPVALEVKRLCEEEEERTERRLNQQDREEEDDLVTDAITGRPYRPLSVSEAEELSADLLEEWERASPRLGVELPVDNHRERVVSEVEASRVVVIAGETGCGKTTRVPRFLLEGRVRSGQGADCNILVTQPRRISAVSVAQRVSQEMGPALKHSVGYQVRLESRPPAQSGGALLFLTVGVLLRKLQSNASLRGVSHVVVDEVHERDVNTDLLLALLRSALRDNPRLRLVLMSATGDNHRLAQYFGGCPVVKVPGFMHPVQDRYLEEVLEELGQPPLRPARVNPDRREPKDDATPNLDLVAQVIEHIHKHGEPGAVLCFLPGWQDIKAVQERLEERPAFHSASHTILPLHSSMSVADQQVVFQRPPEGRRKIVLATNIAETSITIDDIVHVVDAGSHKEQNYDPQTKVSCLDTVWVSRSNITQRRGRAGRCQPGHSYHLFPKAHLENMSHFPVPEILRTPLESLVVQAKIHSPHLTAVDFLSQVLDSPEEKAVIDAVRNLQEIGVLDASEALTPLGERVACMSCDPRLGKVLVLSAIFRCVLPLLSVAACLTRDPFYNSMQNRALVSKSKKALSGSSHSDYLALSRAVAGWRRVLREGGREDRQDYLNQHTLSGASLRFINGLVSQFSENLYEAKMVSASSECQRPFSLYNQHIQQEEIIKAVLVAGLYPNLIQLKRGLVTKGGRFRPNNLGYRTHSGPVHLHRSSVNRGREDLPSRWLTFFTAVKSNNQVFVRDSSSVHPLALLLLTDCDITERVLGDRVEVSFPGRSLFRCELSAQSWDLLWEIRTSIQTMVHRHLRARADTGTQGQDGELLALLVELLQNTDSDPQLAQSEVD